MRFLLIVGLALVCFSAAHAHTTDLSMSRISIGQNGLYDVKVTVSQADADRMFDANKDRLASQKTRPPGFLETLMGQFLQARIALDNAHGVACTNEIVTVDDDPQNSDILTVHLHFDCSKVEGPIRFNPTRLLETHGPQAKHIFILAASTASETPRDIVLSYGDKPVTISTFAQSRWQAFAAFFLAGMEHIVTGYDHLCFLIATVLWASRLWPVVKIVTAFTLSHSITLTLAALGWVTLPGAWVEIAVAATIIFVAVENFFSRNVETRWKQTFLFGFIHGFAFAGGLIEIGLPQTSLVPALIGFNSGVEIGQISVILALAPVLKWTDRFTPDGTRSAKLVYALSALIALMGVYWLLERLGLV